MPDLTVTGPAKTCDVADKIGHYLSDGFQSDKEPLDLRFIMPTTKAGTALEPFATKFVLGASRALAAIIIGEAVVSTGVNISDLSPTEKSALATMCFVACTYSPCTPEGGVQELVTRSVMAKMRGALSKAVCEHAIPIELAVK